MKLVDQNRASWNQLRLWLTHVDALQSVARTLSRAALECGGSPSSTSGSPRSSITRTAAHPDCTTSRSRALDVLPQVMSTTCGGDPC